jgi:hypothetical protein
MFLLFMHNLMFVMHFNQLLGRVGLVLELLKQLFFTNSILSSKFIYLFHIILHFILNIYIILDLL